MIKVELQPKPNDFDAKVRKKGQEFLQITPHPKSDEWKNKEHWRKAIPDMTVAYKSICAYSSLWIKPDQPTIDHYISRNENPNLAYEWENFRLARWRINTRKKDHKDVLDPFEIGGNWFELDLDTFGIKPSSDLKDANIKKAVQETIDRLDLDNTDYREARESWFNAFRNNIAELEKRAPFIAYEMQRQGIE